MAAPRNMTAAERKLRAQIAANTRWANADRALESEKARARQMDRYERQVDPDGVLSADERARRADNARKAHMASLALRSAKVRRERAAS